MFVICVVCVWVSFVGCYSAFLVLGLNARWLFCFGLVLAFGCVCVLCLYLASLVFRDSSCLLFWYCFPVFYLVLSCFVIICRYWLFGFYCLLGCLDWFVWFPSSAVLLACAVFCFGVWDFCTVDLFCFRPLAVLGFIDWFYFVFVLMCIAALSSFLILGFFRWVVVTLIFHFRV